MGSTRWSDDHYNERTSSRAATGTPTFAYTAAVTSGAVEAKTHEKLDPTKAGIRESCDSDTHPNSRAVAVFFDVTGSMQQVPKIVQSKLPQLMGLLLRKSYLESPHIMIGAIGDATCDKAPLQVGQFEAGIEIENDLTNLFLEGGGGGHITESYELALYFLARHTKMDCFEKRKQKGFAFIIGDEIPYGKVDKGQVKRFIGDEIQGNISVEQVVKELEEKFEVYFILPKMTSNFDNKQVFDRWKELLGQRALKLDDPAGIAELIASTIGVSEGKVGHDDLEEDLTEAGADKAITGAVTRALAKVESKGGKVAKRAKGTDIAVAESGAASGIATL